MSNAYFVFPSDADRAENEDLNRVCEYAENLIEDLEQARTRCKLLRRKNRTQKRSLGRKVAELRERLDSARNLTDEAIALAKARTEECDQLKSAMKELHEFSFENLIEAVRLEGTLKENGISVDTGVAQSLAEHNAEVIERELKELGISKQPSGALLGYSEIEGKWIQLRQKAKELQ